MQVPTSSKSSIRITCELLLYVVHGDSSRTGVRGPAARPRRRGQSDPEAPAAAPPASRGAAGLTPYPTGAAG